MPRPQASGTVAAQAAEVEVPEEDEETGVTVKPTPPPGSLRSTRPSLKRRITRPSFMIDLQTGTPIGDYEIQDQIGEGAMGTVFSAVHPLIGKQVAVKILKPELCANQASIDRFVHEAQAVNKIGHPNIVDVFTFGELPDGRFYFVMEWLRGEDLKVRLARGPISVVDACDILDGIARALEAAHAKEIVHRDLKPDNVFLHQIDSGPLMVKLLDFGIAKLQRQTPGTEKTQTGNMLGTPRYISPEQARGVQVDHRSDIYSLGVMAYEMLAGRAPFQGETAMDLVLKHLSEEPPPLSMFTKVPRALEQCVMRMLSKDPDLRPTLEEVRGILVDPSRRMTPLPTRGFAQPRLRSRPRWPILLVAAVGAVGLGILSWRLVASSGDAGAHRTAATTSPGTTSVAASGSAAAGAAGSAEVGSAEAGSAEAGSAATVAQPGSGAGSAPPTPPEPVEGTLDISVKGADDAVILVDGHEWGRGKSVKVVLEPGEHEVEVKPPGRKAITQNVSLEAGQSNTVAIVVPPVRTIRVPTRPKHHGTKPPPPKHGDDDLLSPKGHK